MHFEFEIQQLFLQHNDNNISGVSDATQSVKSPADKSYLILSEHDLIIIPVKWKLLRMSLILIPMGIPCFL